MAGIPCSVPDCLFNIDNQVPPETDLASKLQLLQMHNPAVHPAPVAPAQVLAPAIQSTHRVKLDPPKLSAGSDQETWELFLRSCAMYKSGMGISNTQRIHKLGFLGQISWTKYHSDKT